MFGFCINQSISTYNCLTTHTCMWLIKCRLGIGWKGQKEYLRILFLLLTMPHIMVSMKATHRFYLINRIRILCTFKHNQRSWMQLFLSLSSLPCPKTLSILCDNQSMQSIANTDAISPCTKHIDVGYHFIREHIANKLFSIPTLDMVADIFTKPLLHTLFSHYHASLGLSSIT